APADRRDRIAGGPARVSRGASRGTGTAVRGPERGVRIGVLLLAAATATTAAAEPAAAGRVSAPAPEPLTFPAARQAADPSGRYLVLASASGSPATVSRDLVLDAGKGSGARRPLLTYGTAAVVFWSPDGRAVAITDRDGPAKASSFLFVV